MPYIACKAYIGNFQCNSCANLQKFDGITEKDAIAKEHQASDYSKRHHIPTIPGHQEGENVRVPDIKSQSHNH